MVRSEEDLKEKLFFKFKDLKIYKEDKKIYKKWLDDDIRKYRVNGWYILKVIRLSNFFFVRSFCKLI